MKLINNYSQYLKNFIHMFNNVNKSLVLQQKFINFKFIYYYFNNKKLLTVNT